jgi:hypothetical protein
METVRAIRGVCISVDRHIKPGDVADVDAATAQFLVGIGAVERYVAPAPVATSVVADPEPEVKPTVPVKTAGKKEK